MIETSDLILDKAKFSDWSEMYKNVWIHSESAKYMMWKVTTNVNDAKIKIQKTIDISGNRYMPWAGLYRKRL